MKHWLALFPLLALLSACDNTPPVRLAPGDMAPGFRAERLAGGELNFPEDYRGKVVALRFWADWCPYCKKEMADIEPIYQRHRERGLAVLAVNVAQSRTVARKFVEPLGITYEVALDESSEAARRYGVIGLPTTVLVDGEGKVRGKILGEADPAVFERQVSGLLGAGTDGGR